MREYCGNSERSKRVFKFCLSCIVVQVERVKRVLIERLDKLDEMLQHSDVKVNDELSHIQANPFEEVRQLVISNF